MPSTYSPNLRIELIGVGEQANTWGITTNNNLGTLIEQAICGLVTVDVTSGDVTLTALSGVTDESRNMILNVTGLPIAPRTIYAPAVSKLYVVVNNSNEPVTIDVVGGTAGYTIDPGFTAIVYSDGTDFYSAAGDNLPLSGGTLTGALFGTSATFSGAVSGASGSFSGAMTAASLAGGASTGSGASGTWAINISGTAATATTAATANALNTSNSYQVSSLGVGTAASGTTGEIRATNNVTGYYSSDERLKENIRLLSDVVQKVRKLRGFEFDWTDSYIEEHGGEDGVFVRKHDVGYIAQQVREAVPEAVAERPDGYLGVNYEKTIPVLAEAINLIFDMLGVDDAT